MYYRRRSHGRAALSGIAPPADYRELAELLRARFDAFSPQQQRLAQRVLGDPEGCAFQTVTQVADSVGVDPSTVVRFAGALGLKGYPDLARLCQQRLREQAQMVERFHTLTYLQDVEGGLLQRMASYDQANISRTFANIDEASWSRACRLLAGARLVQVVGMRKSLAPATLLATLLGNIRDEVHLLGVGPPLLPDALRRLGEGDALVAISIHRYVRSTVRALAAARDRGAATIALTDNPSSPLVPHADIAFYVEVAGVTILRSVTALVSLVQTLASGTAMELGADTHDALLREEALLAEFDVYVSPPGPPASTSPSPGRRRASRGQSAASAAADR